MKLTNKDKHRIRQAMFQQVENLIFAMSDENSGIYDDFKHITQSDETGEWSIVVSNYCYKIIGLHPCS